MPLSVVDVVAGDLVSGWQIPGLTTVMPGSPSRRAFRRQRKVQWKAAARGSRRTALSCELQHRALFQSGLHSRYQRISRVGMPVTTGSGTGPTEPGHHSVRNTAIGDLGDLALRMDAFSTLNHPAFGKPATDITTVGRITSSGGNRTVQISAKLSFRRSRGSSALRASGSRRVMRSLSRLPVRGKYRGCRS